MQVHNIICFHNPGEENGYLSNWYLSDFTVEGIKFSSMEQYMMYQKALCFGDHGCAAKILATSDVGVIKALGRSVQNYNETIWNGLRQIIVFKGLTQKFKQNEELKNLLLSTGTSILAEAAVKDTIWGIGLSMQDENRFNIYKWRGQNLLGFALMEVRDELS